MSRCSALLPHAMASCCWAVTASGASLGPKTRCSLLVQSWLKAARPSTPAIGSSMRHAHLPDAALCALAAHAGCDLACKLRCCCPAGCASQEVQGQLHGGHGQILHRIAHPGPCQGMSLSEPEQSFVCACSSCSCCLFVRHLFVQLVLIVTT